MSANGKMAAFSQEWPYGLTKREWFAGMAMQGLLAYPAPDKYGPIVFAETALSYADAILAELAKPESGPTP